jgi:outer membrane protein insertion porin family
VRTPHQGRGRQPGLRWTAGIAVLVLLLAPLLGAQGGAPERNGAPIPAGSFADYQGRRVNAIEILTGARIDRPRLLSLIPQKVGQPLERDKVRRSIRLLYSSGRFSDIEVEAQKQGADEVTLVFHARESFFIGQVSVQGAPKRPSAVQLINAAKLPLGEAFGEERLKNALGRMKALLSDEGYYKAAITPSFTFRNDEQQVDIAFTVERGPLATLGKLEVRGNPALSVAEIERIAKLFPGDHVSRKRVRDGLRRLRRHYEKEGRLEAQIGLLQRDYHPEHDTVDYILRVERGPLVEVLVEGVHLRRGLVKKYVPVYQENEVDDDLLKEGQHNIRDHFQTKGYFNVDVGFSRRYLASRDQVNVVYTVDLGEKHKLAAILFEGNHYFDDDAIREWMTIEPAGQWGLYAGRFSQSLLNRDVEAIATEYKANGFEQAKIRPEVKDDYQGKKGRLAVVLHIDEGPQTRVAHLTLTGNEAFPAERLEALINTLPGQPFSDANMAADRNQIVAYYFNQGFPNVTLDYAAERVPGHPDQVDVSYKIHEGRRFYVDRVIVTGARYTKPFVIQRELRIHSGDPLSQGEMLETQQRLYDLGIFNTVETAVQNPEGAARDKDVIVAVEEARRYTFTYGFGLEFATGQVPSTQPGGATGVSPRVSFDVTRLNFRGRNHTIYFKSILGKLQKRALFTYEAPSWFDKQNLRLSFNAFYDKTQDVHTFTAERLEGSVVAQQVLTRSAAGAPVSQLLYRFAYRRVSVDPKSLVIDPNLIPLYSRPVRVGMPGLTYVRDTRDDPLDSHRGSLNTLDMGVSSKVFGSEANFSRFLFQNSTYYWFKHRTFVLARSTRIGVEHPFGGLAQDFIPLPELFFAGGGNSHRGFSINQAGPRDHETGFPIGGAALWLNNVELRMPPAQLPFLGKNVSPVLFYDMGNVFSDAEGMFKNLVNFRQDTSGCRNLTISATCNLDYVSHAVGGGLRYRTPIGPVRVDFGYNLNPPLFPVRGQARVDQLGHFNFFFSIGQTF